MSRARKARSVPTVLPPSGALRGSGTHWRDVVEDHGLGGLERGAGGELVEQAGARVHVADEVVHLLERRLRGPDDDVDALTEHVELVVGDERGDLDEGVGLERSPVISQSIQTMRSVCARSVPGVVMGAMLGAAPDGAAAHLGPP